MMDLSYHAYRDKLNDEYAEAFTIIESYRYTKRIDAKLAEEWLMELMDNMLTAQGAGKTVESIVGNDIDRFCKEFYNRYSGKDIVVGIVRKIYGISAIIFFYSLIDGLLADEGESFLFGGTNVMPYLCGLLVGFIMSELILVVFIPLLRKRKISYKSYNKLEIWSTTGFFVLAGMFSLIVSDRIELNVDRLVLIVLSGSYFIIYNIIQAVINYRRYGTFREPKIEHVTVRDNINANLETELVRTWIKQYKKKNMQLEKRGKELLSYKEFLDSISKRYDYRRQRNLTYLSTICGGLAGFIIIFGTSGYLTKEGLGKMFDSGMDIFLFVILLLAGCIVIALLLTKMIKPGCEVYANVSKICDEKDLTLEEYLGNEQKE